MIHKQTWHIFFLVLFAASLGVCLASNVFLGLPVALAGVIFNVCKVIQ